MTTSSSSSSSFVERFLKRLETVIYVGNDDQSQHNNIITVGLIDGDIPIFPPFAFIIVTLLAFMGWWITGYRGRFFPTTRIIVIPKSIRTTQNNILAIIRMTLMFLGFSIAKKLADSCKEELINVETTANFEYVSKIATDGPFAYTRNGLYLSLLIIQLSIAIGLDTLWLLLSMVTMYLYLDRIVIPIEEQYLTNQLGIEYTKYYNNVPKWLFI